jgi:hypothetical protein
MLHYPQPISARLQLHPELESQRLHVDCRSPTFLSFCDPDDAISDAASINDRNEKRFSDVNRFNIKAFLKLYFPFMWSPWRILITSMTSRTAITILSNLLTASIQPTLFQSCAGNSGL